MGDHAVPAGVEHRVVLAHPIDSTFPRVSSFGAERATSQIRLIQLSSWPPER